MAGSQDDDMYLFQGGLDQTPSAFAGQDFDNFLATTPGGNDEDTSLGGFMNPNDLTIKNESNESAPMTSHLPRSARSSESSSSSSESSRYAQQQTTAKSTKRSKGIAGNNQAWGSGINGLTMPVSEQYYDDASMTGLDQDFEASNQEMASAFDFETAASTPSGYDTASTTTIRPNIVAQPYRRTTNMQAFAHQKTTSPRLPAGTRQPQFFMGSSREASPFNAMLTNTQAPSPWTKHSPSSGLEETFNHITMNGDSPGNATFSPNMQFNPNGFPFDPDSSGTPSSFQKDMTSPPSTIHSVDGTPHLRIYPTSLKSRVETQIPIKMVLYPLPSGAKKLRLPTHTVSKPKFLAKPEVDRSPEVLELSTSLVCSSAMQDPARLERALARARGEDLSAYTRPSPASSNGSTSSKDDEEKPLNGGEVRICPGCIQRERKRASRKKQKKPDEEEMFQKDEEKRVVVFNTSEIKDWVEATRENQPPGDNTPPPPPGAMQVELPMRIACYCRHQNEKLGFQVIFTIKDCREKVIAQAMTNSIMITDDHKTHTAPQQMQTAQVPQMPQPPQLPGAGVFQTAGNELGNGPPTGAKLFKQSFSTTDLHGLQHNFNPNFPMTPVSNPFAIPGPMSAATSSATMTPRNLSRPASPTGPTGPHTKRRKQSGSGKLPSGLMMTRLDTAPTGSATMPNTAASSPFAPSMPSFMSSADRSFHVASTRQQPYGTSPPTPSGNDGGFAANINRTFSLENLPRQALMSAPSSRQPSRPSSPRPNSNRNSFGANDQNFTQAVSNGLMGQQSSRRPSPIIHKLVPAEGSVTGGTEVTLLGNGFYQGLEVMFGDTEATTTTFWGEKCLNCIAPPALQPGVVAVVFKHEHPQYSSMQQQSQTRPSVFTYTDDREIELLRLALRTIGKQMQHPTDDPYSAAQQLLGQQQQQQQQQGMWPQHGNYNMAGGHQMSLSDLESSMLNMLQFAKLRENRKTVSLNLRRPSGLTMLHLASSMGMNRLATALLSGGANPNTMDNCGHTPMHHAAMHGHIQIITNLQIAGGNHRIRSLRGFIPADLAITLLAHQATLRSHQPNRSRSVESQLPHQHDQSTTYASRESFWDDSSSSFDDSDSTISTIGESNSPLHERARPFARPGKSTASSTRQVSRRVSLNAGLPEVDVFDKSVSSISSQSDPPGALLQTWRQLLNLTQLQQQQLADQLQSFQETASWAMPQLPDFAAIPQTHPVLRRMSMLFPQRIGQKDLTSPPSLVAPPAYEELFPSSGDSDGDLSLKKSSAAQAAADAAADQYYQLKDKTASFLPESSRDESNVRTRVSQLDGSHPQRVELMRDRKLFLFWIPVLALVMGLMLRNSGVVEGLCTMFNNLCQTANGNLVEVM